MLSEPVSVASSARGADQQSSQVSEPISDILRGTDFAPGLESGFPASFEEKEYAVESVAGQVPDFIRGTYYLNGPGVFNKKEIAYRHWLDGDGMVCSLNFNRENIQFRNRYVRSSKFTAEESAGKAIFRTFGTRFEGSELNRAKNGLESPVNVSIYSFGDRLLAFGEQGLPWELDPVTLETRGQYTFNGRLNDASPFSAHPKFDAATHEMFNFGIFFSVQNPKLYFYCIAPEGLRYRKAVPIEYPCSVHDFTVSRKYAVFYLSPYLLDIKNLLQENKTVIESLRWQPHLGSRLLVLDRSTGEKVASIPIGHNYCLHLINAFEQDDLLVVDVVEYSEPIYDQYQPIPELFQTVAHGGPVRMHVDLKAGVVRDRMYLEYSQAPDFPAIDPHRAMGPYEDFWMLGISATSKAGRKFFDQLVHANWRQSQVTDIYRCSTLCYLGGEPVFIGEPGSSNGVVICQEFDTRSQTSHFLIFDAHKVSQGPISRIPLQHMVHLGFHAQFQAHQGD